LNNRVRERLAFILLGISAATALTPPIIFVLIIIKNGLAKLNLEFIFTPPTMGMTQGGIFPAIIGTLYLILGTVLIALPLGVLSAIYLTEYAKQGRIVRLINLAIMNMAGVPSIVYGLFGLGLFVLFLNLRQSLLAGSLTLAALILPIVITSSVEALRGVPQSFRHASYALGASRLQTIWHVVLPNAIPGIATGIILGIGRAAGETAAILFTVAAFFLPVTQNIFTAPAATLSSQVMALPTHLYFIATQVPGADRSIMWGTALVLLAIVLIFTISASIYRAAFRARKKW
jgi:phosphate transport system permease protein